VLLYVVVVVDPCRCWGTWQLDGPVVVSGMGLLWFAQK
jgi:hypothetical protein